MPFYDYECSSCGHSFELRQSFDSAPETACPRCDNKARRKFHAVPIIYKGSGFYTTDYKHTGYSPASKSEDGQKADSEPSKENGAPAAKKGSDADATSKPTSGSSVKSDP